MMASSSEVSFAHTDAMDVKNDYSAAVNTSACDLSISSMSTAMDTATDYVSTSSDIMPSFCEEEPLYQPKKALSPAVERTTTSKTISAPFSGSNPFGFVHDVKSKEDTAAEDVQAVAGTKRRASLLPTYKGSVKISRRHSLDLKALSEKMNAVVTSIGLDAATPVLRAATAATSPPPAPVEMPPSPVVIREPIHLDVAMEEDASETWLGSSINFELGTKLVEQPASAHVGAAPVARRASMRTSISAISRRKSIAQVTAMLDSLQNNVVGSSMSATSAPQSTKVETNHIDVSQEISKMEEAGHIKKTQAKVLQVMDPNISHAAVKDVKEEKEEKEKKSTGISRRKSCIVKKENALVSIGINEGKKEDAEKENGQPEAGLRRSKRRTSMALVGSREAWVDV
ncbi:hypothetical protein EON65_28850 [archaeon]|nr:MAG: hypothetical protein EON65_28850 [archaeon]